MGVKNFSKAFDHSGEITFGEMRGTTVCIDAMCEIYRAILGMKTAKGLTDASGRPTLHISVILRNIAAMRRAGINQIWVFDHPEPNELKLLENAERTAKRKAAEAKLAQMKAAARKRDEVEKPALFSDSDEENEDKAIQKQEKRAFSMKSWMINDIKFILNRLGIQWVEAPKGFEAECACVGLIEEGHADSVMTMDTDAIVFGAPIMIRRDAKKKKFFKYVLTDILEQNEINRTQLIKACIAMGTDFYKDKNGLFRGVGPKTVIAKLKSGVLDEKYQDKDVMRAIAHFSQRCRRFTWHDRGGYGNEKIEAAELVNWLVNEKSFNREIWTKCVAVFQR